MTNPISISYVISEYVTTTLIVIATSLSCMYVENSTYWLKILMQYTSIVLIILYGFGFISSAHANPIVSIASWLIGCNSLKAVIVYVMAQCIGGATAYYLISQLMPSTGYYPEVHICLSPPILDNEMTHYAILEFCMSMLLILCWCVIWSVRELKWNKNLILMATVGLITWGHFSGLSLNAARTLAPIWFDRTNCEQHIVIFMGQLLGATFMSGCWI